MNYGTREARKNTQELYERNEKLAISIKYSKEHQSVIPETEHGIISDATSIFEMPAEIIVSKKRSLEAALSLLYIVRRKIPKIMLRFTADYQEWEMKCFFKKNIHNDSDGMHPLWECTVFCFYETNILQIKIKINYYNKKVFS